MNIQSTGHSTDFLHEEPNWEDLAARDARGEATEEEGILLRENLEEWQYVLGVIRRDIETQFTERAAEAQLFHNQCQKKGPEGKQEWFDYLAQYEGWRAAARRFMASVQARSAEVKHLAARRHREQGQSRTDARMRIKRLLRESYEVISDPEHSDRDAVLADLRQALGEIAS